MLIKNIFTEFLLKPFFSIKENQSRELGNPKNILIILQHYSLGLLLTQIPLIRAIKEKFPKVKITAILSSQNYVGLTGNKLIDNYFIFEERKLLNLNYLLSLKSTLSKHYDVAIVPVIDSISLTSLLLMRFSGSLRRIGAKSLNEIDNNFQFLFDSRIELDWRKTPDSHISDFALDILRPFEIDTKDYSINIPSTEKEKTTAQSYLNKYKGKTIIGLNIDANISKNRWSTIKFIELIEKLNEKYLCHFYLIGKVKNNKLIKFVQNKLNFEIEEYQYNSLGEIAEILKNSNLFITNVDDIMFIAGATSVPQISIFGNTNPFNYSPLGNRKYFIRKSDLIDDITVNDVLDKCKKILDKKE